MNEGYTGSEIAEMLELPLVAPVDPGFAIVTP